MPAEPLPTFKYHPDPLATGSIEKSDDECACCGQARGYIYTGPAFGEEYDDEPICPWCIADGRAHEELGVTFHDEASIPGSDFTGAPDVSEAVIAEVSQRTPGFTGWQQEQWFTCCSDAAAFIGRAGRKELKSLYPQAIESLRENHGLDGEEWDEIYEALDKDGSPTAYVFKCLHCGKYGAYYDND